MVDFNQLWGDAQKALNTQIEDIKKVGIPALVASFSDQAIGVLEKQKTEAEKALGEGVKEIAERPGDPDSFGSKFLAQFQSPLLKQYGVPILIGSVLLIGVGVMIQRK